MFQLKKFNCICWNFFSNVEKSKTNKEDKVDKLNLDSLKYKFIQNNFES